MRLTRLAVLATCAAFALACGDSGGGDRPAPSPAPAPTPKPEPAPAPAPAPEPAPAPAEPTAGGGDASAGAAHYIAYCATCHGASGIGDGVGAQGLPVSPRDFSKGEFKFDADGNGTPGEDADLRLVVENGAGAYGGSALMTPWAGVLDDKGVEDVVAYVRSLEK